MRIQDKMNRHNYPKHIATLELLQSDYRAILTRDDFPLVGVTHDAENVYHNGARYCHYHNGIAISDDFYTRYQINAAYLDTSITGKLVYAPLMGSGQYLYTEQAKYIVSNSDVNALELPDPDAPGNTRIYKKVNFTDEATLSDLYKNCCGYSYFRETDCYEPLPDEGRLRNELEVIRELLILREVGTLYSRIENMNRLIHFLLKRVTLGDGDRQSLSSLLDLEADMPEVAEAAYDQAQVMQISQARAAELDAYSNYPGAVIVTNVVVPEAGA